MSEREEVAGMPSSFRCPAATPRQVYASRVTPRRARTVTGSLLISLALTTAACGASTSATTPTSAPSAAAAASTPGSASPSLPGNALPFSAKLDGLTAAEVRNQVAEAEREARFALRLPVWLPTSARKPAAVRVTPVTGEGGPFQFDLTYAAGSAFEYENRTYESTLELSLMPFRMDDVQGDPWRDNLSGYAVHRLVNGVDANGLPVQTTYKARSAEETIVVIFTGEQPTPEALEAMLGSFVPLASWSP